MTLPRFILVGIVSWLGLAMVFLLFAAQSAPSHAQSIGTISGNVSDEHGPLSGAMVRIQATNNVTTTDANGVFALTDVISGTQVTVTAWAEGYYVGWTDTTVGTEPITITLKRHYTSDNPNYNWFSLEGAEGSASCGSCMHQIYEQWQQDAHSQSAINRRFITMYNGTDVFGNRSPYTRYGYNRDYGSFQLPPDPTQPYYGPGYKLDFPYTGGNCATCHVPAAAAKPGQAYAVDVNQVSGIEAEGVFCEFCHKIGDVSLSATSGRPLPNMPGVMSMRLYRPHGEEQLFFGTLDDVTRRVSYLQLEKESAFCAPCHFGEFWGTLVYNSFGEWLDSPYSDPVTGQTCQNCHMPVTDATAFVVPDKGGLERPPGYIHNHCMPGALDEQFLQNAVTMTVTTHVEEDTIVVQVDITNDQTGHHVPTDSPLRQIFMIVTATDEQGQPLTLQQGAVLPDWAGDLEGLPGVYFAKILQEIWTEIQPSGAYWNPTRIVEDTRLPALATHSSNFVFDLPEEAADATVTIEAQLVFRRAFYKLAQQKNWDIPDILMEHVRTEIQVGSIEGNTQSQNRSGG